MTDGFDRSIVESTAHRPWPMPDTPWLMTQSWYVRAAGRPGVYFFSLDAGRRLAVAAPRALLNLPYYAAVMRVERRDDGVEYQSTRRNGMAAEFRATYQPAGVPFVASAGSIEYFLTERYCLYHRDRRGHRPVLRFTTGLGPCSSHARRSRSIRWPQRVI